MALGREMSTPYALLWSTVDVTFTFTTVEVHMWCARLIVVTVIEIGVCQIDAVVAIPTATSTSTDVEPSPPSSSLLSALP